MAKYKKPRRLSLVKAPPVILKGKRLKYPYAKDQPLIFLGEIPNMPGHCIVVGVKSGRIYSGYHTENFVELSADEV